MAGEPGRSRVSAAAETAWAIRDRYAERSRCRPTAIAAILEDLGERVGAIYQAEVDALEVTARAIGRMRRSVEQDAAQERRRRRAVAR